MTLLFLTGYQVLGLDDAKMTETSMDTENPQQNTISRIVFLVDWYDVGKAALEGLTGVLKVSRGFQGLHEINTVIYDSSKISPEEMIFKLKKAGTYIGVSQKD